MTMTSKSQQPTAADDPKAIRDVALNLLARREHSTLELHHKLTRRGFAAEAVTSILEQLRGEDLLSEQRFAEVYAHSRADKGYGPLRIQNELRQRGISSEMITMALSELEDFWEPKLAELHHRRFADASSDRAERAKQMRFLRHRGYTLDQINHLFKTLE